MYNDDPRYRTYQMLRPVSTELSDLSTNHFLKKKTNQEGYQNKDKRAALVSVTNSEQSKYALAFEESNGFFTDIAESDWKLLKERQRSSTFCYKNDCKKWVNQPSKWYQVNFEPTFTCQHEMRLGGLGDGPKWVCDPHRIAKDDCLVYSIGSYNNFDFEESVLRDISKNCEIHTFDPNVGMSPSNKPAGVHFHPWGLAQKTRGKMKSLKDIVSALGHEHRQIDIFKIDCEGCEWSTFPAWLEVPNIRQIQAELHKSPKGFDLLSAMFKKNFVIFHKEPNTYGCKGDCIEYAFLKLNKTFFETPRRESYTVIPSKPAVISSGQTENTKAVPVVFLCGYGRSELVDIIFPDSKQVDLAKGKSSHNPTKSDYLFKGTGSNKKCPSKFPGKIVNINAEPDANHKKMAADTFYLGPGSKGPRKMQFYCVQTAAAMILQKLGPTKFKDALFSRPTHETPKFLEYTSSNCAGPGAAKREKAFNQIVDYFKPLSPTASGKCYGSHPELRFKKPYTGWINDVKPSEYRFSLCMDRGHYKGYVTEKILLAFLRGTIPIWHGSEEVFNMFNKNAFVWYDVDAPELALQQIAYLEKNRSAWKEMRARPILAPGAAQTYFSFTDAIGGGQLLEKLKVLLRSSYAKETSQRSSYAKEEKHLVSPQLSAEEINFMPILHQDEFDALVKLSSDLFDCMRAARIQFVVYGGAWLGTQRHRGLIPWDDDVDLEYEFNQTSLHLLKTRVHPEMKKLGYKINWNKRKKWRELGKWHVSIVKNGRKVFIGVEPWCERKDTVFFRCGLDGREPSLKSNLFFPLKWSIWHKTVVSVPYNALAYWKMAGAGGLGGHTLVSKKEFDNGSDASLDAMSNTAFIQSGHVHEIKKRQISMRKTSRIPLHRIKYLQWYDPTEWKTTLPFYAHGLISPKNIVARLEPPIDVVIPWSGEPQNDVSGVNRDDGILKFTIRSYIKYTPWVRTIFLFADPMRKPDWLAEFGSRVQLVNRCDHYIGGDSNCPTQNGLAVLLNLHTIPELAERFIVSDDDLIITKPLTKDYFFKDGKITTTTTKGVEDIYSKNDITVDNGVEYITPIDPVTARRQERVRLPKHPRMQWTTMHVPWPFLKSILIKMQSEYPEWFQFVSSHTMRFCFKDSEKTWLIKERGNLAGACWHEHPKPAMIWYAKYIANVFFNPLSNKKISEKRIGYSDLQSMSSIKRILTSGYSSVNINDSALWKSADLESLKTKLGYTKYMHRKQTLLSVLEELLPAP